MNRAVRLGVALAVAAAALLTAASGRRSDRLLGFTRSGASSQAGVERRLLASPSADRIRDAHRFLADKPHMAGSARDRELAEWTRDRFRISGLEEVTITTHDVLLPWPEEVTVEMTAPRPWRASMREEPVSGDSYTQAEIEEVGLPYHAYSASGDVTAPVVYAGSGTTADYDWLISQGIDVRGKIALVRYSVPYSYRGFKAFTAQQRGAAGILIYSDPADDGAAKGKVYPDGPWGPESHIERGGIVYDFLVPGDPLTPGWASVPGAPRVAPRDAVSLPTIVSAPLSFKDARVILESLGGPEVPGPWHGAGAFTYRAGPGHAIVRMRVRTDDRIRPVWTVTGIIRGSERPEDVVIVGNHRDAWVYGGVDPSSGSAALDRARARARRPDPQRMAAATIDSLRELGCGGVRADVVDRVGRAARGVAAQERGRVPERRQRRVRIDLLGVRGAGAQPGARRGRAHGARSGLPTDARRDCARPAHTRSAAGALTGTADDVVDNRLGSGSDYTVFLNFLGVPVADLSFDGPNGVYHSLYDNHNWVATIGDPGFRYHVALVQFWGLVALRLAGADVVPLDYEPYARRIDEFAAEVARRWIGRPGAGTRWLLTDVRDAARDMRAAAARFNERREAALRQVRLVEVRAAEPPTPGGRARPARSRRHPRPSVVPPSHLRAPVHVCA